MSLDLDIYRGEIPIVYDGEKYVQLKDFISCGDETIIENEFSWELFHMIEKVTGIDIENLEYYQLTEDNIKELIKLCNDKLNNYNDVEFPCKGCPEHNVCSKIKYMNEQLEKCSKFKYWYENKEDLTKDSWEYFIKTFENILEDTDFKNDYISFRAWW